VSKQGGGRDGTRQTIAILLPRVEWGDNRPSTDVYLPNGHIRPSKRSHRYNTWSGGDNRPSTMSNLPNGCIRPSKRSHRYQHMEGGDNQPSTDVYLPMATLGLQEIQNNLTQKKSLRGKVGSCFIPCPSHLDQERLGSGVWQCGHQKRHVCLPHDAVWCHPSHHHIVKVRSTCASTPTFPRSPSHWHVC